MDRIIRTFPNCDNGMQIIGLVVGKQSVSALCAHPLQKFTNPGMLPFLYALPAASEWIMFILKTSKVCCGITSSNRWKRALNKLQGQ